ncbi:hypothetical protein CYFUS_005713 [Cystobacter fuscus]|uniref:Uncharacterized protein n=1 Tax=Cystobacter fuscus TaxID=43 RepID=A0A250J8N8_9BACT|nr:hypothetical protein [Cystobacter fuscus]ATB40265.1 hypothetical protein CYFUS_005713 [Cystobacter fuscus]
MTTTAWIGITLLLGVSLVVRVFPALLRPPLSQATLEQIETILPIAVLINLAIFSASSEIAAAPGPALLGLGILGVLTFAARTVPILVTLIASTTAFLLLLTALNR